MQFKIIINFIIDLIEVIRIRYFFRHKLNNVGNLRDLKTNQVEKKKGINIILPNQLEIYTNPVLKAYGCYFLSLLYLSLAIKLVFKKDKTYILDANLIDLIFKGLSNKSIDKKTAFVKNPNLILSELGISDLLISFNDKKEDYVSSVIRNKDPQSIYIVQYDYKNFSHFCLCNYKGDLIFDSLGISEARSKGVAVSVRRFKMKDQLLIDEINKIHF